MKKDRLQKQQQIRMSDALVARIHEYRRRVRKQTGLDVGFAAAARTLLDKSLLAEGIR